jgi:hypothetical protein
MAENVTALPTLVDLNPTGLEFRYSVGQTPDGSLHKSLICEGKVLDPQNMVDVIAHVNSLITTGKAAEL